MSDPKEYIDRGFYCENVCRCNGSACEKSKCPIWNAPAADVAPVVHGERKFGGLDFDGVDVILKKHRAFVMATINGHGCHIGTYKKISLEADGDWIIDVDVEGLDVTGQGDVAPVVHGEWVNIVDYGGGNCVGYCSVCKAEHASSNPTALRFTFAYCRWCGAKMDGGRP